MIKNVALTVFYSIFLSLYIAPTRANEDGPGLASVNNAPRIYTIYNILMDETATSSRKASRTALKKAQRIALEKLFRKIIREEDHKHLPPLTDGQITELVSGIEIANEKSSPVRYIADFTVHFSRDKIYNFLSAMQLPFAETLSNPVNILTVLEKDGASLLWEKGNDWRMAWLNYDTINNLVPIKVITPSRTGRMSMTAWQAQQGDPEALDKFARLTGLRTLYIMSARVENNFTPVGRTLTLKIFKAGDDTLAYETMVTADANAEDLKPLYDEAIKRATYWLDNQWKEKVMIHFGTSSHLIMDIRFDQSEDWFKIKKRLESISLIRKVTYRKFKTNSAEVEIEHSGDVAQITLTLEQEDLILQAESSDTPESESWVLTLKKHPL
ncbi:hypothetical protein MNBD_ALPHA02-2518 [hydrothermal vent metagenome]|uniref:DUF2066 domain-containing protein n=1 Tax=hydrothermal vent metagenome TaxID=652676 RepID=A0A3B0S1D2_9ZZZZ